MTDTVEHWSALLSRHRAFRGIGLGSVRIKELLAKHGADLPEVVAKGDVEVLKRVMPIETAALLISRWATIEKEAAVMQWFAAQRIGPMHAMTCIKLLGADCRKLLEENPYILATLYPWTAVDAAGLRLGVDRADDRRVVGAVKAVFRSMVAEGNTVTSADWLTGRVRTLVGAPGNNAVEVALRHRAAFEVKVGIQPAGAFRMERAVEARISSMLGDPPNVADRVKGHLAALPGHLTHEQRTAVRMAFSNRISCVVGGAGVGKTTCLKALAEVAGVTGVPLVLMAPTGKAASRMRAETGAPAHTIAAALHAAKKKPIADEALVVVDEASMLDLPTAYRIFEAMPASANVAFVGDDGQLPPVGLGLVFHRMIRGSSVPRTALTIVHRQRAETGIPSMAAAVREGRVTALGSYSGVADGVHLVETTDVSKVVDVWRALSADGACQVVAARNATVDRLNAEMQAARGGEKIRLLHGRFNKGDPICCVKNDYPLKLWNGSMGVVHGAVAVDGAVVMDAHIDGEDVRVPARYLNEVQLAYAITVHRSQGSSFPRVIVVLEDCRVVDRAWLYTAVTRAERQVVLVGSMAVLEAIVRAPAAAERRNVALSL